MKPQYGDPDYLNTVCRYCSERASSKVNFKDGTSILACPTHTKEFVPTVVVPPWNGGKVPPLAEGVESVTLWPEEEEEVNRKCRYCRGDETAYACDCV